MKWWFLAWLLVALALAWIDIIALVCWVFSPFLCPPMDFWPHDRGQR